MSEYSSDLINEIVDAIESAFRKNDIQKLKEYIIKIETQNKELIEERDMLKDDYEKLCNAHTKLHELYNKKTLELAESKATFERDNKISYDLSVLKDKKIEELLNVNINLQERIRILEEAITESHERQIKLNILNSDIIADQAWKIQRLEKGKTISKINVDIQANGPDIEAIEKRMDEVINENTKLKKEHTNNIVRNNAFKLAYEEKYETLKSCIHDKSEELKKYKKKYKAELTRNNIFIGEILEILQDMNNIIYRPDHYKIVNVETLHSFENRLEGSVNRVLLEKQMTESHYLYPPYLINKLLRLNGQDKEE